MNMRVASLCLTLIMALVWSSAGLAQQPPPPPPGEPPMEIVPLVDENAPLLVVWFSENQAVSLEDASAAEGQVFEDIGKRMDVRVFSRDKTIKIVTETGNPVLQNCNWSDGCLVAIGKLAKADKVIGIKISGTKERYFLALKRLDLGDKPARATKIASGSLTNLLMGGINTALTELLDKPAKPAPGLMEKDPKASDAGDLDEPAPVPLAPPSPAPVKDPKPAQAQEPVRTADAAPARAPAPAPTAMRDPPKATIVAPEPKDELPPPAPERPGFFRRHLGSTIALGVGLVAACAGTGFGVMAQQAQDDVEFQWDPARDDDGKNNALAANVLFGVAGAAAVTAVVLFILEPGADEAEVSVTPTANGAAFRF